MEKIMRIKSVTPEYTGGGIYVFLGAFTDGTFFIADSDNYDVRIVNENPEPTFWDDDGTGAAFPEWQNNHLVKDLDIPEKYSFMLKALKWIKKHRPQGNYIVEDIDFHISSVKMELS